MMLLGRCWAVVKKTGFITNLSNHQSEERRGELLDPKLVSSEGIGVDWLANAISLFTA
jgi:hypothetical protein